jgi:hypothetical protein
MFVSNLIDTIKFNTAVKDDVTPPVWVGAEGISDVYQDGESVNIRWNAATDNSGITPLYKIYISRFANTVFESFNLLTTVNGTMLNTRFEDTAGTLFESGREYYVGVRALDQAGNETDNINYGTLIYQNASSLTAQEIWEYSDRTLTAATTSSLTAEQNAQLFAIPTSSGVQSIIDNLEAAISAMIGNPTPQADLVGKLSELDAGIRQVLINITNEINENQIIIEKGSMKVTI